MKSLCGMLAVLAFTACSNDSDEAAGNDNHIWHVSLTASMGDATNRALDADGNTITAKFAASEVVKVVKSNGSVVGTLTPQTVGTKTTTLTGEITGSFSNNEVLTLRYHSETANYDNQVGTLAGISANQDNAEATLTITDATSMTFASNSVTLKSKQSITKFTFKDGSSDIIVKTFGIAATGLVQSIAANGTETVGAVTGTLATPSKEVYVALRNTSTTPYSFYIQDNTGNWYRGTKNATLANGKYYTATVSLTKLPELTSSSEGTVGVIGKLPAIVIDLGETIGKKAVALMNTGALCPEHYGKYYTFANQSSDLKDHWYVPSKEELKALAEDKTNAWVTQNGVNGGLFTIGSNTFFLPAAGLDDGDNDPSDFYNVSTFGYYWSSEAYDASLAYCLSFSSSNINSFSDYQIDGLTVRPFHSLP